MKKLPPLVRNKFSDQERSGNEKICMQRHLWGRTSNKVDKVSKFNKNQRISQKFERRGEPGGIEEKEANGEKRKIFEDPKQFNTGFFGLKEKKNRI